MAKKSKFLKNLLTTASAAAVLITGVQEASAAARVTDTNNAPATLNNGVATNLANNAAAPTAFNDGNSFYFSNAIALTTASAVTVNAIDMNNQAAGPFTVANNVTLGSVIDSVGANLLAVTVNDGQVLTLNAALVGQNAVGVATVANTYTNLGVITLKGANGTLTFSNAPAGGIKLTKAVNADVAGNGKIVLNGQKVTFDVKAGATKLGLVDVGDGAAIFSTGVDANVITVGTGSLTLAGGPSNVGSLNFTDVGTANFKNAFNGDVNFAGFNATVNVDAGVVITGSVNNTGAANNGKVIFAAGGEITGIVGLNGPLNTVVANGAGLVKLSANTHRAATFDIKGAGVASGFEVVSGGVLSGNVTNSNAGDNNGALKFKGSGALSDGFTIGADGKSLKVVTVNADAGGGGETVALPTGDHYAEKFAFGAVGDTFTVANNGVLHGAIGGDAPNAGTVKFLGNGGIEGIIGGNVNTLLLLDVNGAGTVDILKAGDHTAVTFQISNVGGILRVADGGKLNGNVNTTIAGNGVLQFKAGGFVAKAGSANSLSSVQLLGAGTVTLGGAEHKAGTFELKDEGAILAVNDNANSAITGNIRNTTGTNGKGTLKFLGQGKVSDTFAIGLAGKSLETVEVAEAKQVVLSAQDHYATSFKLAKAGSELSVKDGGRLFGDVTYGTAGEGKLVFQGGGAVSGNIGTLAAPGNGIKEVSLDAAAAGTVTLGAYSNATKFTLGNAGSVLVVPDGGVLKGEVVGTGGTTIVKFQGGGTLDGATGNTALSIIEMAGPGALTLSGNEHKAAAFRLDDAKSVMLLSENVQLTGPIDGKDANANQGILRVTGKSTVVGQIGNTNAINSIEFTDDDKTLTLDNNAVAGMVKANSIKFSNSGILELTGNESWTVEAAITTDAGAKGTVLLNAVIGNKDVNFNKVIGNFATGNALGVLKVQAGVSSANVNAIKFSESVNIDSIQFLGASNLSFEKVDGQHRIGELKTTAGLDVNLKVAQSTELLANATGAAINLGAAGELIKNINFANGKSLTLGNNTNIFAQKISAVDNNGALVFKGNSTIKAAIGEDGNRLASITTSNDATTVVNLSGDVYTYDIKIGSGTLAINAVTLKVTNNIDSTTLGTGTLKFINDNKLTVTTGQIKDLNKVEFAANEVDLANTDVVLAAGKILEFSGANATTVTLKNTTNVGALKIVNSSGNNTVHVLNVSNNTVFTGAIGNVNNQVKIVAPAVGGVVFEAKSVDLAGAIFTTAASNQNTLNFTLDGAVVGGIGESATQRLAAVNFNRSGKVLGGTYAQVVSVAIDTRAEFNGVLDTAQLTLAGAGSTAAFGDGVDFTINPTQTVNGKGILEFTGDATISTDIGSAASPIEALNFTGPLGKVAKINTNNVRATAINLGATTLTPNKASVTLTGTTNATNIDLGSNQINIAGNGLNLSGAAVINTKVVPDAASDNLIGGNIVIAKGATLNLSALTSVTLNIDDLSLVNQAVDDTSEFTLVTDNGNFIGLPNTFKGLTIVPTNPFSKWTYQIVNGNLNLTQNDNTTDTLKNDLGPDAVGDDLANIAVITDSPKNLAEIRSITNPEMREQYIRRITAADVGVTVIQNVTDRVTDAVGLRVVNLAGLQGAPVTNRTVGSAADSGLSAGDDDRRYGIWAAPFYNQADQKLRNNAAGYKATTFGATFGFDTRPNDDMIIGVAATVLNTDVKNRDFKSGDKTKADSVMFSIYGMQQLTNNWFAQGVATVGNNRITTNEKRITGNNSFQVAMGKYTSMSFGGELLLGYNFVVGNVAMVTPVFGTKFTRVNDGGYRETGTTNQNLTINRKASNKIDVVFGLRFSGGSFGMAGMLVTPEIHGFVTHDLIGKNSKPVMKLDGAANPLAPKAIKSTRTYFNPGVGLNAEYNFMEYGIGYDMYVAKKYTSQQGTLKVRVNF